MAPKARPTAQSSWTFLEPDSGHESRAAGSPLPRVGKRAEEPAPPTREGEEDVSDGASSSCEGDRQFEVRQDIVAELQSLEDKQDEEADEDSPSAPPRTRQRRGRNRRSNGQGQKADLGDKQVNQEAIAYVFGKELSAVQEQARLELAKELGASDPADTYEAAVEMPIRAAQCIPPGRLNWLKRRISFFGDLVASAAPGDQHAFADAITGLLTQRMCTRSTELAQARLAFYSMALLLEVVQKIQKSNGMDRSVCSPEYFQLLATGNSGRDDAFRVGFQIPFEDQSKAASIAYFIYWNLFTFTGLIDARGCYVARKKLISLPVKTEIAYYRIVVADDALRAGHDVLYSVGVEHKLAALEARRVAADSVTLGFDEKPVVKYTEYSSAKSAASALRKQKIPILSKHHYIFWDGLTPKRAGTVRNRAVPYFIAWCMIGCSAGSNDRASVLWNTFCELFRSKDILCSALLVMEEIKELGNSYKGHPPPASARNPTQEIIQRPLSTPEQCPEIVKEYTTCGLTFDATPALNY